MQLDFRSQQVLACRTVTSHDPVPALCLGSRVARVGDAKLGSESHTQSRVTPVAFIAMWVLQISDGLSG